jgi:hypothetical protein
LVELLFVPVGDFVFQNPLGTLVHEAAELKHERCVGSRPLVPDWLDITVRRYHAY